MPHLPSFNTAIQEFALMQQSWANILNPVVLQPISSGNLLTNIALVSGANVINHKLGRKLQGWFIVRLRGSAPTIYDNQDSNQQPNLTLNLQSSGAVVVDIFVF